MSKYQKLDEAILDHLRSGGARPISLSEARAALGLAPEDDSDKAWRLIDRRLRAIKKTGRVTYERAKGGGRGRWVVVEAAGPRSQDAPSSASAPSPGPAAPTVAAPVMVYAARFRDLPGYGAVTVDEPERAKAVAKDIAAWVRNGAVVERVTLDAGRAGMGEYLKARRARDAEAEAEADAQGDLFGGETCRA